MRFRPEAASRRIALASVLPAVAVCAVTRAERTRLIDAVRGRVTLEFCATFSELSTRLQCRDPIDAVILGTRDGTSQDTCRMVREIAERRPRTAIVVWCDAGSHHSVEIRALAVAGAHQFLFAGVDDHGVTLRAVLDLARRQCGAEWVLTRLASVVPSRLHPMLEATLARPDAITTVSELAAALGVHRKTLFNHCRGASFFAPAELIAWARLAMVAYMVEMTALTIEQIAIELGYASDTALRNAMKRYTGQRAGEIRRAGGVEVVIHALAARIRRGGDAARLRLV